MSAGGDYTDEQLKAREHDKKLSGKDRKAAKQALTFRRNFRAARALAAYAAHGGELNSDQQAAVGGAVGLYGTDNNGITVGFHNGDSNSDPGVTTPGQANFVPVSFRFGLKGNALADIIGHEGAHIEDQLLVQLDGATITHAESEWGAYEVESFLAQGLGVKYAPFDAGSAPEYQIWNRGWKAADISTLGAKGITNKLSRYGNLNYNLVPGFR